MRKLVLIGILSMLILGIVIGGYYYFSQDKETFTEMPDEDTIIQTNQLQDILDQIPQSLKNIKQNLKDAENK